jgi:hypothetical protein
VLGGSAGSPVNWRFSLPCVGDASAKVLNEGRSIPVTGGTFTDSFADANAIHIYRIDGGSSCGLSASPSNHFSDGEGRLPAGGGQPNTRSKNVRLKRRQRGT